MKIRVGFGFDVHQLVEGRELWLGGVLLEHTKGLLGHSDASRTAATGGFGIGLSIAKSIAEAHHGTICASTKENRITFTAELK